MTGIIVRRRCRLSVGLEAVDRGRPEAEDGGDDALAQRYEDIANWDAQLERARPDLVALKEEARSPVCARQFSHARVCLDVRVSCSSV